MGLGARSQKGAATVYYRSSSYPRTVTVSVQFNPVEYRVRESAGSVTLVLEKTGRSNSEVAVFLSTTDIDATGWLASCCMGLRVHK